MGKRRAEKQLTDRNWQDDDDDNEESLGEGEFKKANEEILARRPIRGLPRRSQSGTPEKVKTKTAGVNGGSPTPSLFGGFGSTPGSSASSTAGSPAATRNHFGNTDANSSSPLSSPKPNGAGSALSSTGSLFGGFGITSSAASSTASTSTSASPLLQSIASSSTSPSKPPPPSFSFASPAKAPPSDPALKYFTSLRGLNLSLLTHLQSLIEKDPFADLTTTIQSASARYASERGKIEGEWRPFRLEIEMREAKRERNRLEGGGEGGGMNGVVGSDTEMGNTGAEAAGPGIGTSKTSGFGFGASSKLVGASTAPPLFGGSPSTNTSTTRTSLQPPVSKTDQAKSKSPEPQASAPKAKLFSGFGFSSLAPGASASTSAAQSSTSIPKRAKSPPASKPTSVIEPPDMSKGKGQKKGANSFTSPVVVDDEDEDETEIVVDSKGKGASNDKETKNDAAKPSTESGGMPAPPKSFSFGSATVKPGETPAFSAPSKGKGGFTFDPTAAKSSGSKSAFSFPPSVAASSSPSSAFGDTLTVPSASSETSDPVASRTRSKSPPPVSVPPNLSFGGLTGVNKPSHPSPLRSTFSPPRGSDSSTVTSEDETGNKKLPSLFGNLGSATAPASKPSLFGAFGSAPVSSSLSSAPTASPLFAGFGISTTAAATGSSSSSVVKTPTFAGLGAPPRTPSPNPFGPSTSKDGSTGVGFSFGGSSKKDEKGEGNEDSPETATATSSSAPPTSLFGNSDGVSTPPTFGSSGGMSKPPLFGGFGSGSGSGPIGSNPAFGSSSTTPPAFGSKPSGFSFSTSNSTGSSGAFGGTSPFTSKFGSGPSSSTDTGSQPNGTTDGASGVEKTGEEGSEGDEGNNPFVSAVMPGEEDEDTVKEVRTKLYEYKNEAWKEVALGVMRLKKGKEGTGEAGKARLICRTEAGQRVILNHRLNSTFSINPSGGKSLGFSTPTPDGNQMFRMRVKNDETAEEFRSAVMDLIGSL